MTIFSKLKKWIVHFRDSISGRYVTKDYAEKHPETTTREKRRRPF